LNFLFELSLSSLELSLELSQAGCGYLSSVSCSSRTVGDQILKGITLSAGHIRFLTQTITALGEGSLHPYANLILFWVHLWCVLPCKLTGRCVYTSVRCAYVCVCLCVCVCMCVCVSVCLCACATCVRCALSLCLSAERARSQYNDSTYFNISEQQERSNRRLAYIADVLSRVRMLRIDPTTPKRMEVANDIDLSLFSSLQGIMVD
jgi:hypothetical protein